MFPTMKNQRVAKKFSLKGKSWSYRGEGNANLVLSIFEEKRIVRLRKSLPSERRREEERVWLEVDFCKRVMLPLLGERFVHQPTVVCLLDSELTDLNEKLRSFRPIHRHSKGLYVNKAALFPDLCFLPNAISSYWTPTFSVEVKPKQGWIPLPERRLSKCTFCLNQYFKLKQGSVKKKSQYCPLDLFSGNRSRMKFAIEALLACPQNNFKMFKDGSLVYDDSTEKHFESVLEEWFGFSDSDKLVENFTSLLIDALISDFTKSESHNIINDSLHMYEVARGRTGSAVPRVPKHLLEEAQSLLSGPSCYKETESLPENCILSRILQVQKLDLLGSDEVYRIYCSRVCREDFSYVYDMLLSPRNILKPLNSYLLATTAKDCSILIAFQKVPVRLTDHEYCIKDLNNIYYNFSIGVSDLDPKPASCIEKHRKRSHDVVVSCIEILRSQN